MLRVLLLSILNVMFYLDQRHLALALTVQFFVLNTGITILTQWLGPAFFGYGFAGATVITSFTGLVLLARKVDRLEYETFMLQA